MKLSFKNQWILVTGASSGLGRQMAIDLALEHSADLVLVARRLPQLESLKIEIHQKQSARNQSLSKIEFFSADLSSKPDILNVISVCTEKYPIYAAVLNAGITHFGKHTDLTFDDFEKMLQTNVTSVVQMTTEFVRYFEAKKSTGGVLLVASMAGLIPASFQSAYSGTKGFLVSFGIALHCELIGKPYSVSVFAPGGIVTEMTKSEKFHSLRGYLMPVTDVSRMGLREFRKRKALFVPGFLNQFGLFISRFLPRRFLALTVASNYRKALRLEKE